MRFRSGPIRLLIVEDSPTARDLLVALFRMTGDFQVVGTAMDGEDAVRQAQQLRPDVITMDVHMPRMNGLEAARQILRSLPVPIVMVTASVNQPDMDLSFEAIQAGALTVVKKPVLTDPAACEQVIQTVRLMADVRVITRWNHETQKSAGLAVPGKPNLALMAARDTQIARRVIVGIAASTGGPSALVQVLRALPSDFPLPILVVQHITRGFAGSLAEWMNKEIALHVRLAESDEWPMPGTVLIAPDDHHMQVSNQGSILLHNSPPYKGLRPSANYLFFSMAQVFGRRAAGVILTGMGDDGVDGLYELRQQGGLTLAQDEASSVVYGMPREAVTRKAVDQALSLEQIGTKLLLLAN